MSESRMKRSKKKVFGVIYGRSLMVILLLIVQVALLVYCVLALEDYMVWVYGIFALISLFVVVFIVNSTSEPDFKLVWMVPIVIIPIFGGLLYLFVHTQWTPKLMNLRHTQMLTETRPYLAQDQQVRKHLSEINTQVEKLAVYSETTSGYPIYENTEAVYFPLGEDKFEELKKRLNEAEKFIFLEYFIVEEGIFWDTVLDILKRKVQEGVEVRMLYDGMCSIVLLPYSYPKQLQEYGIQCKMFSPIRPVLSTHYNNRDHRKILVIDGNIGFTGGINLADEYINVKERFGHWKDTAVMIRGDAVKSMTMMFLQMWNITGTQKEDFERYIPSEPFKTPEPGDGFVMPYGDSPVDQEPMGETVYVDILNRATRYVHIMTPYLILDYHMIQTLCYAAKRGVEVAIIMPGIPDKPYAFILAKSYYKELLTAGVKIYEYTPGFVHAKVFVSDDEACTVGTINLDYRSLYLHFECGCFFYQNSVVGDVERDFQETLKKCRKIHMDEWKKLKGRTRLAARILRLFAPLM